MSDQELLDDEIKPRFQEATDLRKDIREEGTKDVRALAGDPWDPEEREAREKLKRPCITTDELNQYTNQLVNQALEHPRAVKVSPAGMGATPQAAQLRADKIREIEYRSSARVGYGTMFQNAVERSYGYLRVKSEWQKNEWTQELTIEEVVNPDLITPDPWHLRQSGADMRYCFVHEMRDKADFQKGGEFAGAKIVNFDGLQTTAPQWLIDANKIRVAEYWKIETAKRRLLALPHPVDPNGPVVGVWKDTIPPEDWEKVKSTVKNERDEDVPSVCMYLTNGVEILKKSDWKGAYIPIIQCLGKVLYVDEGGGAKRKILSLPRLARSPFMLYCYYRTQQAEIVGMIPKTPVMGPKGMFRGVEYDWQKAPHEPLAFVEYNIVEGPDGQTIALKPERLPYDAGAHLQALELCAEGARRAIQSAMGAYALPTTAQRQNEKSGIALQEIQDNTQVGNFHFIDHYDDSIRHCGIVLNDRLRYVHDTAGPITIRTAEGESTTAPVNNPNDPNSVDLSVGEYDVTISSGPSLDSQRDEASDLANSLIENAEVLQMLGPERAPVLLAKAIQLRVPGPVGEMIAAIINPPQQPQGPDPQALAQQLQDAQNQLQQVTAEALSLKQKLEGKVVETQGRMQIEAMRQSAEADQAAKDREVKIAVAELEAKVTRLELFMEERARLGSQQHDTAMAAADAGHEQLMAQQAHDQAQQQAVTQAALQPPPQAAQPNGAAGA